MGRAFAVSSNRFVCHYRPPNHGHSLYSRTTLLPAVRMSKSSRQITWWWCTVHTHELDTALKPKRGRIRAVCVQPPLAHVAVPAGLHLADKHYLQTIHEDNDPRKLPVSVAGIEDRLGLRGTESKTRVNIDPVGAWIMPSSYCQSR